MPFEILRRGLGCRAGFLDPRALSRPRAKRIILGAAVLFLLAGIALSIDRNPGVLSNLNWRPALILVLIAVPATVAVNAWEFMLMGRLLGRSIRLSTALETTIIGTAANLLPIPGAALVRVAALKVAGAGYGEGTKATLLVACLWAGVAFVFAGAWMLRLGVGPIAELFVAGGLVAWLGCFGYGVRQYRGVGLPIVLSFTKLTMVTIDAVRMYLSLSALGVTVVFDQAAALAVAGVVGNAVSIVPAGLGVRELVSAGLAPLVGLGAGLAFLAATLNRILGLATVAPLSVGLLLVRRGQVAGGDTTA